MEEIEVEVDPGAEAGGDRAVPLGDGAYDFDFDVDSISIHGEGPSGECKMEQEQEEEESDDDMETDYGSVGMVDEDFSVFENLEPTEYDDYRFIVLSESRGVEHYIVRKLSYLVLPQELAGHQGDLDRDTGALCNAQGSSTWRSWRAQEGDPFPTCKEEIPILVWSWSHSTWWILGGVGHARWMVSSPLWMGRTSWRAAIWKWWWRFMEPECNRKRGHHRGHGHRSFEQRTCTSAATTTCRHRRTWINNWYTRSDCRAKGQIERKMRWKRYNSALVKGPTGRGRCRRACVKVCSRSRQNSLETFHKRQGDKHDPSPHCLYIQQFTHLTIHAGFWLPKQNKGACRALLPNRFFVNLSTYTVVSGFGLIKV